MPLLENPQHEAFAQARFAGKSLLESHYVAGYAGDRVGANEINQIFEVRERIAELYRDAASQAVYEKSDAVRDLLAIVHASASDANADNPLCEPRLGKEGLYYRFPSKLQAMARLIKLMGWDHSLPVPQTVTVQGSPARQRGQEPSDPDPTPEPNSIASDGSTTAAGHEPVESAQSPLSARQEAFAIGRVKGLGVMAAYRAAGYTGDSPNLAWRLNSMPAIKARIAELNGGVEAATGYGKDDAIRDLAAIIHANPAHACPHHPLAEERKTSWGSYHRFPSKLTAIALLMKLLGWHDPAHDQDSIIVSFQPWLKLAPLRVA